MGNTTAFTSITYLHIGEKFLSFHILFSPPITFFPSTILLLTSSTQSPSVFITEPRKLKLGTTSITTPFTL